METDPTRTETLTSTRRLAVIGVACLMLFAVLMMFLKSHLDRRRKEMDAKTEQKRLEGRKLDKEAREAKIREAEEFVRRLGHINLAPKDTSQDSLNHILLEDGKPGVTSTERAIAFDWPSVGIQAEYYKPGYSSSQIAADIRLSDGQVCYKSLHIAALNQPEPRPDISFAGLKPGTSENDLLIRLREIGATRPSSTWTSMRRLPNGWTVSWMTCGPNSSDVYELTFDNPKYHFNLKLAGGPL